MVRPDLDATLMGVMARVPVPGTEGAAGALTPEQVAHAIAVSRLVAGTVADDICVHPLSRLALQAGANAIVVRPARCRATARRSRVSGAALPWTRRARYSGATTRPLPAPRPESLF